MRCETTFHVMAMNSSHVETDIRLVVDIGPLELVVQSRRK